jgi:hypothetical protein
VEEEAEFGVVICRIVYHRRSRCSKPIPTPYIQSNLHPRLNRQPRMPRLHIPRPIGPQVLPKDRITSYRLEYDSFPSLCSFSSFPCSSAVYKPTPSAIQRPCQPRKPRPPTRTVRINIDHKTTHPIHLPRALPVIMVRIMPTHTISLYLEPFEHQSLAILLALSLRLVPREILPKLRLRPRRLAGPALQGSRARFDALHGGRAREGGDFGFADERVEELVWAGGDVGGGELVGAVGGQGGGVS